MAVRVLWIGLGALVIALLVKRVLRHANLVRKSRQHGCELPRAYRHIDPLFGLDLFFRQLKARSQGNTEEQLRGRFALLGKTHAVNSWGTRLIDTMDKDNIRAVMLDSFASFGVQPIRLDVAAPFIGPGTFTTDGKYWEYSRKLIQPLFAKAQVSDLKPLEVHIDRLFERLPTDGSTVDLQGLLALAFLDHATETIFGKSTDTLLRPELGEDASELLQTFNAALSRLGLRMLLGRLWLFRSLDTKYNRLAESINAVVDQHIDRATPRQEKAARGSPGPERYVMVDELVATVGSREEIRHQLLNVFLPARDAVAAGLSGALFHLARHPRVWDKLREEVMALQGPLTYGSLQSLVYMKAVLNESLRLTTPATDNYRICTRDCVLPTGGGAGGTSPIFVSKGDLVTVHFGAMHHDSTIWGQDASEFRPERWDGLDPGWTYMPFSAGPRICPGKQMALTESAYVLVRLMQRFEKMENRDPEIKFIERERLTLESRNGVLVSLTPVARDR